MALSVLFSAVPAGVAGPGRVARVNERHGETRQFRLIGDKTAQLKESPVSELPSHLSIKAVASLSYAREGFESECLTRGNRVLNKLLADVVVDPLLIVGRASAHTSEVTLGVLRPLALQERTNAPRTTTAGFDSIARIGATFTVGSDIDDTEVNAENAVRLHQWRVGQVACRQQVEVAAVKGEVTLPLLEGEKAALVVSADERQAQAAINRPDRDFAFINVPAQDAVIVGNRTVGLKRALNLLVQLVGVGDFGVATNNDLRCEVEGDAGRRIRAFMQRVLPERLMFPGPRADAITGGVGAGKRLFEGFGLRPGHNQFDLCGKFHDRVIIPDFLSLSLYLTLNAQKCRPNLHGQFLPCLKASVTTAAKVRGFLADEKRKVFL